MFTKKQMAFARQHSVHAFVVKYLEDLGFDDEQEILAHLYPKLTDLPDPSTMKNMPEIAGMVASFIVNSKIILIWGDYDVDGITASAVLFNFIREVNGIPHSFIPNRLTDGYGLNRERIKELGERHEPENTLLITVDCGISNKEEVAYAQRLGFTVIVTDHHSIIDSQTPDCLILNAKQEGCKFVEHQLAGVGTAFFLIMELRRVLRQRGWFDHKRPEPALKKYLDLVAIGTVADLVPLTTVNRTLIKAGFEVMASRDYSCKGLEILLQEIDLEQGPTTGEEISFKISPLINASGRMGTPQLAFNLLTSTNENSCTEKIKKLIKLNKERKRICKQDLEKALTTIPESHVLKEKIAIIFGSYHDGVVGITASKITELYNVPAIVFSECVDEDGNSILKGSCRSIDGIDILKLLHHCREFTISYGGHQGAAGVTIPKGEFERFKGRAIGVMQKDLVCCDKSQLIKSYGLPLEQVFDPLFLKSLEQLEPMGQTIPKPSFYQTNVELVQSKFLGADKEHLQLIFRGKRKNLRGVGFYLGKHFQRLPSAKSYRIEYTPYLNKFNKKESWQVLVSSIHPEEE